VKSRAADACAVTLTEAEEILLEDLDYLRLEYSAP
jgi:hypothetical protein